MRSGCRHPAIGHQVVQPMQQMKFEPVGACTLEGLGGTCDSMQSFQSSSSGGYDLFIGAFLTSFLWTVNSSFIFPPASALPHQLAQIGPILPVSCPFPRLGHLGCKASNSLPVGTIQKHHYAIAVVLKPWRHVRT